MEHAKKTLQIYILKVLQKYSDENHCLTQKDIVDKVSQDFGMDSERRAISRNILDLQNCGFNIVRGKKAGYYLVNDMCYGETAFLIDCIFSSQTIPADMAENLIGLLLNNHSKHEKTKFKYVYQVHEIPRTKNPEALNNIEKISEAIQKNKKITFCYNDLNNKQELVKRKNGKVYKVNPYFSVINQGKYYLVCNSDYYDNLANYRIDLMSDLNISEEDLRPVTDIEKYKKGIDKAKYISEHIYMFSGETVKFKVKLLNESTKSYIIDWFGRADFVKVNGEEYALFSANEQAGFYWCLQYMDKIELCEPIELREKYIKMIEKTLKMYKI